jgi:tetratricopeptide (TPR) repeat protein
MNWLRCGLVGVAGLAVAVAQTSAGLDLNDQGNAEFGSGNYAQAERIHNQAVQAWRALGSPYQAHMAASLVNLGFDLCADGKRREGADAFEQALALNRSSLGPQHIRTIDNLNLLGGVSLVLGDLDRAAAVFSEALPVERELYPNHVELARTLAGLGAVRLRQGKAEEALPLAEEALSLAVKLDEDGPEAAPMYFLVAEIHRAARRPERAYPLYRKARALCERSPGPVNPLVARILSQEGLILMDDGKLGLAERNMTQALDLLASSCPRCDVEQAFAENNLALLRLKQKKYQAADQLLTHALALQEKAWARPGPEIANTLRALALARQGERRYDDAARLRQRAGAMLAYR